MDYIKEANNIVKDLSDFMSRIKERSNKFIGLQAVIPSGLYKDRVGEITSVCFDDNNLFVLIQPYRLKGKGDKLLWKHSDARKYYNILNIKNIFE